MSEPGNLVDRYNAILAEEDVQSLRSHIRRVLERLRVGAVERGERPILHDELEVARQQGETARRHGRSAAPGLLLLPVGYSPEPLLLTVAFHAPRDVILLVADSLEDAYLDELAVLWDQCRALLGQPPFAALQRRVVRDSAGAFFQAVREIVEPRRPGTSGRIVLDVAGAKKTMTAGAFLAAGYLDLEASYVDFDSYDPVLRRPDPGTSRPHTLIHPLRLFRLREEERLAAAFDGRRFEEAAALAVSLEEMAGSPEVVELLGEEPARLLRRRYGGIARTAAACGLWAGGFYRDAAVALASAGGRSLPPTVQALAGVWPPRDARRGEIVSALAEDRVFENPSTFLAYLLDVLVWMDGETVAHRPRDGYLRLFGAMESTVSYLVEALRRRPEGLTVEPFGLALLESELPADVRGAAIDWRAALAQGVVTALRESATTALATLLTGDGEVMAKLDLKGLFGERADRIASLLITLARCRVKVPLDPSQRRAVQRARQAYYRFSDLRHKAVHWMAPVPREDAEKMRSGFTDLLRELVPVAASAFAPGLAGPGRAELESWAGRLLAAAAGEIPADCRPPRLAELEQDGPAMDPAEAGARREESP